MQQGDHQSYFDNIQEVLIKELSSAKHTIYAAVAWLTNTKLLDVLAQKARQGVSVQLVISGHERNEPYRFKALNDAGGEIYMVGGGDVIADTYMHNKFCVIDYKKVLTGSYNWSLNAETNEENLILLHDERLAFQYAEKCIDLIKQGTVLDFDDSNHIRIAFFGGKTLVEQGESVPLEWKVENASVVSIENVGINLAKIGKYSVTVNQDATFVLTAKEGVYTKKKTVFIRVIRHPQIEFFKASEKGIVQGVDLELSWQVKDGVKVEIDNGIGEVAIEGKRTVSPSSDVLYTLTAFGETKNVTAIARVMVFPLPTVRHIEIPVPTKINLETVILFTTTKVPTGLHLDVLQNDILQKVPRINLVKGAIEKPIIQDIARSLGKDAHDLTLPEFEKKHRFIFIKSRILDGLEKAFTHNWRASQIISQIRKTYGIK